MSTDVRIKPNLPPALLELVHVAVGHASVCWHAPGEDGERTFDATQALVVVDQLSAQMERLWDAREAPMKANLNAVTYHLSQLDRSLDLPAAEGDHLRAARAALRRVTELFEEHR